MVALSLRLAAATGLLCGGATAAPVAPVDQLSTEEMEEMGLDEMDLRAAIEAAELMAPAFSDAAALPGWGALREAIDDFDLVADVAVSVGDSRGELFRHTKGSTAFDTQMTIASATKWVSGVCVMRTVEEGYLTLDDLASTHLPYWTVDPADARSRVTLRHLLSFVSGMSGSTACPAEMDFNTCVADMYTRSATSWEPGEAVVYNEVHLMYAGAMAAAASNIPMEALFERYIFGPAQMTSTFFTGPNGRPLLGSGLSTTPEDYGNFLRMYYNGELVGIATRTNVRDNKLRF